MSEQLPKIGLLNLMPAATYQQTSHQWLDPLVTTPAQAVNIRFDDDPRIGNSRASEALINQNTPFSDAANEGLDALIITGANLERKADSSRLPFSEIRYHSQLTEVIDWARQHTKLTIYSCLASHIALNHIFGLERDISTEKHFGVYQHDVVNNSLATIGMDAFTAPHSRWGNISAKLLTDVGVEVVAISEEAGWLLAEGANEAGGIDLYVQGHPEYEACDLDKEYKRDLGQSAMPENYYPNNDPTIPPQASWGLNRQQLFTNIKKYLD